MISKSEPKPKRRFWIIAPPMHVDLMINVEFLRKKRRKLNRTSKPFRFKNEPSIGENLKWEISPSITVRFPAWARAKKGFEPVLPGVSRIPRPLGRFRRVE